MDINRINAAIAGGGEEYWREIYRAYFPPLAAFIGREYRPMPADIAEELACRALLKLIHGRIKPRFGHEAQFVSWLYKAARTTALDYVRSNAGKAQRKSDSIENDEDLVVDIPERYDGEVVTDEVVVGVLAQLSEMDRKLLVMRADGTAYGMIAEELGLKENAARTYFLRAKKKFAKLYTEALASAGRDTTILA
jgi:RNA polymerase sigma factor (sigma-70 family)